MFANYLAGRHSYVEFRSKKSTLSKIKQGVPQGGVLSPSLFNLSLSGIAAPPEGIEIISYADDCSILATGNNITEICDRINDYLDELNAFFSDKKLTVSAPKSSATLFTTWTKEVKMQLKISIGNQSIPTVNHPKILGVTLDNMATPWTVKRPKGKIVKENGESMIIMISMIIKLCRIKLQHVNFEKGSNYIIVLPIFHTVYANSLVIK